MQSKSPAFQFYAADYLADENVALMTLEEEGAYIRALAYCWREGSLPADDLKLSRLLKGCSMETLTTVRNCFKVGSNDPSRLVHPRLEIERQKQAEWKHKSSEAGKLSGKARRAKKLQAEPTLNQPSNLVEPKSNSSSSFSSSSSKEQKQAQAPPELPGFVDPDAWQGFVEMRKKIPRVPFTDRARDGILADLEQLRSWGIDPNERLRKAVNNGWRGVLFDNDKPNQKRNPYAGMIFANAGAKAQ